MNSVIRSLWSILVYYLIWGGIILAKVDLDDSIIQKDLYKILGLTESASLKDIKKSFRRLAQKHHPDKAKSDNMKRNEWIFRGIAEAYEVLSSKPQREEYDRQRSKQAKAKETKRQYKEQARHTTPSYPGFDKTGPTHGEEGAYIYETDELPTSLSQNPDYYQPSVAGPVLNARQIIFPYDPILATSDRQTFALLDENCAIVVYKGNLDDFIRNVLIYGLGTGVNGSASGEFDLVYQTKQFSYLRGFCFAGLDEVGNLQIFKGHPIGYDYEAVWSSSTGQRDINSRGRADLFYLNLSPEGLLAINKVTKSRTIECTWSSASSSCNPFISAMSVGSTRLNLQLKKVFAPQNLAELPSRLMESKAVKALGVGVSKAAHYVFLQLRILKCRVQYVLDKYILQVPRVGIASMADCAVADSDPPHAKRKKKRSW